MIVRCKECKRHRCGRCGWAGRRKTGTTGDCPRCGHAVTVHAVFHRSWIVCSLGPGAATKHRKYECPWCHRMRREDKMRRWDRQMQCKDDHGCARVGRRKRGGAERKERESVG